MEIINNTITTESSYTFKPPGITYGVPLKISGDSTNCKLSYIHGIGNLKSASKNYWSEIMQHVLKKCKGAVILNTIEKIVYDWLKENYEVYYASEVPIGYNHGYQYHICIRNNALINSSCKIPKPLATSLDKTKIKEHLLRVLKSKRRKNDYVEEFINSL